MFNTNEIADYTQQLWQQSRKTRKSQSGWISGNAVCCHHNGENADTRGRGGLMITDGKVSWHCFNCGFKTSYQPGRPLSFRFRKLLSWMGADPAEIQRLVVEALRVRELIAPETIPEPEEKIEFTARSLPEQARSFRTLATADCPADFYTAVEYVADRGLDMNRYDFYWTPEVEHKLSHRVIIPFYYQGQIVGYTARAVNSGIVPKYHSNHPAHFVFNLDQQPADAKFVIVCEGPIDAMSIDGVSVQTNEISEQQAELIEQLGRRVIVVPDFDRHVNKRGREVWAGESLALAAIEYGWSVSFPVWSETCKDINDAVRRYGKLFTLKAILAAAESNSLKIKLRMNQQR